MHQERTPHRGFIPAFEKYRRPQNHAGAANPMGLGFTIYKRKMRAFANLNVQTARNNLPLS